ncbi:hypothetical protein AB0L40_25100 [Patulibacter sp. NPDC049589]|uniref:hypothetical protein n=1 Tax=Patulibacter sp. NPDC049589 TaxID=3154731 RepID=UPI0034153D42
MAGYLHLAQAARAARPHIRSARELQAQWKTLPPERQAAVRQEWGRMEEALEAVHQRLTAGPRGFAREFRAAYRGDEAEPVPEPRAIGALVRELGEATVGLRDALAEGAGEPADDGPRTLDAG